MKRIDQISLWALGTLIAGILTLSSCTHLAAGNPNRSETTTFKTVLLISIDGLHEVDLENYIAAKPSSALAALGAQGTLYTNAQTSLPSDSFPGMVALVTGGSPNSTGIWYDHTYDKALFPAGSTQTSHPATPGAEVHYDETIDSGYNGGSWGVAGTPDPLKFTGADGIDSTKLPVDPTTFAPVYPHDFIRVNTIFEVAKAAGLRTAWSDKHPVYEVLNGPSGTGIQDLYTPEINALVPGKTTDYTRTTSDTITNDTMKVNAVLNELKGYDHTGTTQQGVPAILGMNFQAVSVAQKATTGGYKDAKGTPSDLLLTALDFVDNSLGSFVSTIKQQGRASSTLVIVTAKHGQSPIDPTTVQWVDDGNLTSFLAAQTPPIMAHTASNDTCAFLWLDDRTQAAAAAAALTAATPVYPVWDPSTKALTKAASAKNAATWGTITKIQYGNTLPFTDPTATGRFPDLVVTIKAGSVYGKPWKKIAEHGSFSADDTHVALLVSYSGGQGSKNNSGVRTAQVAPTILHALGLDPALLQAVQKENVSVLPNPGF